jgi:indolepyruvate ferredoxin oxidoreductase, alpha subunit
MATNCQPEVNMATMALKSEGKQSRKFLLGNESIVQGALEAGVNFASGYPGTPSSEIVENLAKYAKELNLYVEWSTNEKVAAEGAAAAAFSGLRSMVAMKNAGLSVALDFLTHLSLTGLGDQEGAMLAAVCDDPDAHSSGDETDSRWLAKFAYAPLMEPSSVQEAREIIKAAYDLSERHKCYVMVRSYTRLSHGSSVVELGELAKSDRKASSDTESCITPYLAKPKHEQILGKLARIKKEFESSPFNSYQGPDNPGLAIVASGSGVACAAEAVELLGLEESVGLLKLATLWPFPRDFIQERLGHIAEVLVVEEVDPFVESHVKEALYDVGIPGQKVYGKLTEHIPGFGEINPDRIVRALCTILDRTYRPRSEQYTEALDKATDTLMVSRGLTWCPGCPHRASFWSLGKALKGAGLDAYITGDIGCYTLDVFPEGKCQMNLLHAMGSSIGLAAGLGQLGPFGHSQPIISMCGDSTFFHSAIPPLINAVYNNSNLVHIVLDNDATAMTGFQAHPGAGYNARGESAPRIDIAGICRSMGITVETVDPFEIKASIKKIREMINMDGGVRVLIMKKACELLRMKREKVKPRTVEVNSEKCLGSKCGVCYATFSCPAFVRDEETGKAIVRQTACPGCGVCADICPGQAITVEETA